MLGLVLFWWKIEWQLNGELTDVCGVFRLVKLAWMPLFRVGWGAPETRILGEVVWGLRGTGNDIIKKDSVQ